VQIDIRVVESIFFLEISAKVQEKSNVLGYYYYFEKMNVLFLFVDVRFSELNQRFDTIGTGSVCKPRMFE
jgi:hypothetical protein